MTVLGQGPRLFVVSGQCVTGSGWGISQEGLWGTDMALVAPQTPCLPVCMLWSRASHTDMGRDVVLDVPAPLDHSSGCRHRWGLGYTAWSRRAHQSPPALRIGSRNRYVGTALSRRVGGGWHAAVGKWDPPPWGSAAWLLLEQSQGPAAACESPGQVRPSALTPAWPQAHHCPSWASASPNKGKRLNTMISCLVAFLG